MGISSGTILAVGNERLNRAELTSELSRTTQSILELYGSVSEDAFVPMIVDNSLQSHTALLAMAELGMNVAVIDSYDEPLAPDAYIDTRFSKSITVG